MIPNTGIVNANTKIKIEAWNIGRLNFSGKDNQHATVNVNAAAR